MTDDPKGQTLKPDALKPFLRGALGVQVEADHLELARLPQALLALSPDPAFTLIARMAAGIRLAFETDLPFIELDVLETSFQIDSATRRASEFDLFVDGAFVARGKAGKGPTIVVDTTKVPPAISFAPGGPSIVHFDNLPARKKVVEIWLPHTSMMRLNAMRVAKNARIEALPQPKRLWAHYGSSISHGFEAQGPSETWPTVAARKAGREILHLGLAGQCQLDGFVARAIRDSDAELISLKLGINVVNGDTMRERAFKPAVHNFLDTIREKKRRTPIIIVSPIFCPSAENNPGPTIRDGEVFRTLPRDAVMAMGALSLSRIREILEEAVSLRRAQGDENLHYFGGLELFNESDVGDLPDGLHPNAAGLKRMGERFAEKVLAWF